MASNGKPASVVPPQNLEAEESVLGSMMVSQATIDPVVLDERLQPDDFYRDRHRIIFDAILALHGDANPVDVLTVSEELAKHGNLEKVGGKDTIGSLAARVPAPGSARHYAKIVKQNSLMRRLDAAGKEIVASVAGRDGEASEMVENAERLLFKVAHDERAADFREISEILHEEIDKLEALSTGKADVTGTSSGFRDLDDKTGGFQPGNLVIIAARPSIGKSALVCNIAENVSVKDRKPVAMFSLEMSEMELAHRFIASQARIPGDRLRKGQVSQRDWPKVVKAANTLESAPLWIDDSSDLGMLDLRAKARRLHAQEVSRGNGGLGMIIVDYLQLMRADDPRVNRVEQVAQFSRGLKILARELSVPVLGLSQLSRAPEQRGENKRPILSDLRESGCLTAESRVYLPEEGRYAAIGDLEGRSDFKVLALDPATWRLEPRTVRRAFATGTKPVHKLTTQLGRSIRATANHRFLTIDGWRRLDELQPGEHIALPRRIDGPEREAGMSDAELALLGLLIGDGCTLPRHAIQFTARTERMAKLGASLAKEVFGARVRPRVKAERNWYQAYLAASEHLTHRRRNPVSTWLTELGAFGKRSWEKRVPHRVFEQPNEGISEFLAHLWATDGCVWLSRRDSRRAPAIYFASSSSGLATDVQSLLLRLGINARLRVVPSTGQPQHHVIVSGAADQARFLETVGGLGKEEMACRVGNWLSDRAANTNRDVVPRRAWRSIVEPARVEAGLTQREVQSGMGMSYCGSALERAHLSRDRAARIAAVTGSDEMMRLATSDVYWDQVVAIEPDGEAEVFDLTVDGLHNFIAEDIVVHNSIEQDADVVCFIYRDDYYNPEDSKEPGIAELILAKHRNGPIGTVKLAFLNTYPKFADQAHERHERPIEQRPGEGPPMSDDLSNGSGGADADPGPEDDFGDEVHGEG